MIGNSRLYQEQRVLAEEQKRMQKRAQLIGARLSVNSQLGKGTTRPSSYRTRRHKG